jgi:hypothetical protein
LSAGSASIMIPNFKEIVVDHHSLRKMLRRLEVMGRMTLANAETRQPPNVTRDNWRLPLP